MDDEDHRIGQRGERGRGGRGERERARERIGEKEQEHRGTGRRGRGEPCSSGHFFFFKNDLTIRIKGGRVLKKEGKKENAPPPKKGERGRGEKDFSTLNAKDSC